MVKNREEELIIMLEGYTYLWKKRMYRGIGTPDAHRRNAGKSRISSVEYVCGKKWMEMCVGRRKGGMEIWVV